MKQFLRYFWNTIAHPAANFDALAAERSVRWGLFASALPVLQIWGNVALHFAFGMDWLGTKPLLADPTFVAGFGQWRVNLANWVPIFVALMPLLALLDLVLYPGIAQLMSKLWVGHGTFEQMLNTLAFAAVVPGIVLGALSEWLFSVPMNFISGNPYWWNAAMQGEFGPVVGGIWNSYVFGIYLGLQWIWIIALGSIAIRRVQHIPVWAAILTMVTAFAIAMFISSVFVR